MNALVNCDPQPNSNGWIFSWGHSIYTLLESGQPARFADQRLSNTPVAAMDETSPCVGQPSCPGSSASLAAPQTPKAATSYSTPTASPSACYSMPQETWLSRRSTPPMQTSKRGLTARQLAYPPWPPRYYLHHRGGRIEAPLPRNVATGLRRRSSNRTHRPSFTPTLKTKTKPKSTAFSHDTIQEMNGCGPDKSNCTSTASPSTGPPPWKPPTSTLSGGPLTTD